MKSIIYFLRNKAFIVIPIIVVVIIAIFITILYFTTDLFKSNEALFWKYFSQAENVTNILESNHLQAQENFKVANSYTSNGNIFVVLSQGESNVKQFNMEATSRHDANINRTYADITLKNGELDLLNLSYINSNNVYGIKCGEVFANYLGIQNENLTELAGKYGLKNIPNSINLQNLRKLCEFSQEQTEHIQDKYMPIVSNYISPEQYQKETETIEINGKMHNTNMYKIEVSSEVLTNIIVDCLNTLKTDTEMLTIISNKLTDAKYGEEYTNAENIITQIDNLLNNIHIKENVTIHIYEEDRNTVRITVVVGDKTNIVYDNIQSYSKLSIEAKRQQQSDATTAEGIIDLTSLNSALITSRAVIEVREEEEKTVSNIQLIPDTNNVNNNINIELNYGKIYENAINNSGVVTINSMEEEKQHTTTITFDNNITKTDTIEEIPELTGENTAIANNYTVEDFSTFTKRWANLFIDKVAEKMVTLGVEELAVELEKLEL